MNSLAFALRYATLIEDEGVCEICGEYPCVMVEQDAEAFAAKNWEIATEMAWYFQSCLCD